MVEISTTATFDRLFQNSLVRFSEKLPLGRIGLKVTRFIPHSELKNCIPSIIKYGAFGLIRLIALFLSFSVPTRLNFVISDITTPSTVMRCSSQLTKKILNGNFSLAQDMLLSRPCVIKIAMTS